MDARYGCVATYRANTCHIENCCINPTAIERMKISWFPAFLSLIVAVVLAWLAYDVAVDEQTDLDLYVAVGTAISVVLTLGVAMACKLENTKVGVNLKVWSGLMFVVMLITNFCFAHFGVKMPWYVVVTICLLVLHLGLVWSISRVNDV